MERICGCLYVHFETVLGFTGNEQMGCLEAFRDKTNGTKHPDNVTSHVGFPRNVSGEYITNARKSPKKSQKQPKLKVIHAFELSQA